MSGNTKVSAIVISNNAALTLTVNEVLNDTATLNLVSNANTTPIAVNVSDTAADIAASFDQLNADSSIGTITISDSNAVTLTVLQALDDTTALGKLVNANAAPVAIDIFDTAAHISSNLDALQNDGSISVITVSDNASVVASVAQLTNDALALSELVNANASSATVTVQDTAANIDAALGTLSADSQVTSVVISNNAQLVVNASALVTDAHVFGELSNLNDNPLNVKVLDSASQISSHFATIAADSFVTSVVISNNAALSLTAAEALNDTSTLTEVANRNGSPVVIDISDTAAHISANFDALAADSAISAVTISDENALSVSYAQFNSDTAFLEKVTGTFSANVTGVTGLTVFGNSVASFTETESAHQPSQILYYNASNTLVDDRTFTYNQTEFGQSNTTVQTNTQVAGAGWSQEVTVLNTGSQVIAQTFDYTSGKVVIDGFANGLTFQSPSTSGALETITAENGTTNDVFNFSVNFGQMTINGYVPGSETMNFSSSDFANIAAVENHTSQNGSGYAVITLDAHDTITLVGVSVSQFESHSSDWHFI